METNTTKTFDEREPKSLNGIFMLSAVIVCLLICTAAFIYGISIVTESAAAGAAVIVISSLAAVVLSILFCGFHAVAPNEAIVMTLFGKYYGTIKREGFYFVNPFSSLVSPENRGDKAAKTFVSANGSVQLSPKINKKISTKTIAFNNDKQKVNDVLGNPIIIGAIVIWRVADPTKAVFSVENYKEFLSIPCDSVVRNVTRLYPYDFTENDSEEKTLRGSSQEIADLMRLELQKRVESAGLEIEEVRITHLSYSEEIAAAMLQRQQAVAIIAARQKIVEGAVSMVKMALDQLSEEDIVLLDEERKAAMVSNLLVILCGNKDAQPVINSGSIY